MWRVALVAITVVGCHAPYQAEATMIGNGQIAIRAEHETSESAARQLALARANELCPGGYEVIDDKSGAAKSYERIAVFGRREVDTPEVTLVVRCASATARWWCHAGHSTCFRDRSECARRHLQGLAGCEPRAEVYCFDTKCYGDRLVCELDELTGDKRPCAAVQ